MKKALSVFLAMLCVVLFTAFALGSGEDSTASVSSGSGETQAAETEASAETLTAHVGDTLTTADLKITYVSCSDFTDYNEFLPPKDGNKIVKLTFDAENIGDTDCFLSVYDFTCYADNAAAESYYSGEDDLSATVSPGRKASGSVYFEVPKGAQSIEVEYETDFWTGSKAIFVVE